MSCSDETGYITTTYTLGLNAGLTRVLTDSGANTYLYGNGRIAQFAGSTASYFLADHLGSVRQLTNVSGAVTLAKSYQPYGSVLSSNGTGASSYGFTGEWTSSFSSSELIYLRARWYASAHSRFITRDTWGGYDTQPMTQNRWLYTDGNPVNATDPSGRAPYYCYDAPAKKLTPNPGFQPCAPGVTSFLHRSLVRQVVDDLQRRAPANGLWAELTMGWAFSAYGTLDLGSLPRGTSTCNQVWDFRANNLVCLPANWLDNGSDNDVLTQGSGRIPNDFQVDGVPYGGRIIQTCLECRSGTIAFSYGLNFRDFPSGGRVGTKLTGLEFKAVAAPDRGSCSFPDQAMLFAPDIMSLTAYGGPGPVVNSRGLLSVEDSGGAINCENGRIDIYTGVRDYNGIVAPTSHPVWGGSDRPHNVWVLVDSVLAGGYGSVWDYVELCPDSPIYNVYIKRGAGATVQ